jgi:hypothetical protein
MEPSARRRLSALGCNGNVGGGMRGNRRNVRLIVAPLLGAVVALTFAAAVSFGADLPKASPSASSAASPTGPPPPTAPSTPAAPTAPAAAPPAAPASPPAAKPAAAAPASPASPPAAKPEVTVLDNHDVEGILGREVLGASGESMGRVVDVLVDRSGRVRAAIIDFGGFLGVGSRKIAVDWNALHFPPPDKSGERITLELNRDQVNAAPQYQEGKPAVVLGALGKLEPLPFAN